jgi:hypothetical protein
VDDGVARRIEQAVLVARQKLLIRVKTVGDQLDSPAETPAKIICNRFGDRNRSVGSTYNAPLERRVNTPLKAKRPITLLRLEGPAIAEVGDPGDSAAAQGQAHRVRRMGR